MWNSGIRKVSHRRHLGAKMNSAGQLFALDAAVVKLKASLARMENYCHETRKRALNPSGSQS